MTDEHEQAGSVPDYFPGDLPRFQPGQTVLHRRYGYRGVIVDFDMACKADEHWYQSNPSQPARDQVWYHVLVDGAQVNTYVAEQNLTADQSRKPVDHPLVHVFLDRGDDGHYQRNDVPWPQ